MSREAHKIGVVRGASSKTVQRLLADFAASKQQSDSRPQLLSGTNPQIAKGDGNAPVQDYIAAMPVAGHAAVNDEPRASHSQ